MTTVLIIEDDVATNNFYATTLSQAGFLVVQATSCRQAIVCLKRLIPTVILLDMWLSDGSGAAILRYLRANDCLQNIKVAIVSGSARYHWDAKQADVAQYLYKPVLADTLCACIQQLVEASHQHVG
jgi:phosphoserine phosphatase RsbU/P